MRGLSEEQCELVRAELRAIANSSHFRKSKRYPAFLRYIVEKTLCSREDDIKERTIGVAVFGRPADYDTGSDPLVRNAASEVRMRLALYRAEIHHSPSVEISLPPGSYVPKFHFEPTAQLAETRDPADVPGLRETPECLPPGPVSWPEGTTRSRRTRVLLETAFALILGGILAFGLILGNRTSASEQLWAGFLNPAQSVLICVPEAPAPASIKASLNGWSKDNPNVAAEDVSAIMHSVTLLMEHKVPYQIQMASTVTLEDLKERPVILIGGPSNLWTMRLLAPLRYHFRQERYLFIEDSTAPHVAKWIYDASGPNNEVVSDCAIIARLRDKTTGGLVMVIAGAGRNGTEAAGDFVASGALLAELKARLPHDWKSRNLEVVLKSAVIDHKTGAPSIEAFYLW